MKNVAIIGGGITGCVAALLLTKHNCKINLYEKSNSLGGILKDYIQNDKVFFSGPQYIDSANWINDLYELHGFNKVLKKIEYVFGSYTDLFDNNGIVIEASNINKKADFENSLIIKSSSYYNFSHKFFEFYLIFMILIYVIYMNYKSRHEK